MQISVVRQIAIPLSNYPYISINAPISDAIAMLCEHRLENGNDLKFKDILVIGAKGEFAGVLKLSSLLENFFRTLLRPASSRFFFDNNEFYADFIHIIDEWFKEECQRQSTITVETYMSRHSSSVEPSAHVVHALGIMLKSEQSVLPVIQDNVLWGVVRMEDIFNLLGKAYQQTDNTTDILFSEGNSR